MAHGIRSVAAPIRERLGMAVAAVNLTVQAARWSVNDPMERFLDPTIQTAQEISRRLGYEDY